MSTIVFHLIESYLKLFVKDFNDRLLNVSLIKGIIELNNIGSFFLAFNPNVCRNQSDGNQLHDRCTRHNHVPKDFLQETLCSSISSFSFFFSFIFFILSFLPINCANRYHGDLWNQSLLTFYLMELLGLLENRTRSLLSFRHKN